MASPILSLNTSKNHLFICYLSIMGTSVCVWVWTTNSQITKGVQNFLLVHFTKSKAMIEWMVANTWGRCFLLTKPFEYTLSPHESKGFTNRGVFCSYSTIPCRHDGHSSIPKPAAKKQWCILVECWKKTHEIYTLVHLLSFMCTFVALKTVHRWYLPFPFRKKVGYAISPITCDFRLYLFTGYTSGDYDNPKRTARVVIDK